MGLGTMKLVNLVILVSLALGLMAGVAVAADGMTTGKGWPVNQKPIAVTPETDNKVCKDCHGVSGFALPAGMAGNVERRELSLDMQAFSDSAHGKQKCVACHTDIQRMPHKKVADRTVNCVQCHTETLKDIEATKGQDAADKAKVGKVVENIGHYMASVHAEPSKEDPAKPKATCTDCHNAHFVYPIQSKQGQAYRLTTPAICGTCHEKQKNVFDASVHGIAITRFESKDAATCADCHTAHQISKPKGDAARVLITENCGDCHDKAYDTYKATYHGQVSVLGYGGTAKCFDCHGSHEVQKPGDPRSKVHEDNRLKTCQQCHKSATRGFTGFYAHGNTNDFKRYPEMWIASKFMIALLVGVFAFFWAHSAWWFYREWKDKKAGTSHVLTGENGEALEVPVTPKHVKRFSGPWRAAHLILAIAVMTLVITGTPVLFAESFWAPTVIKMLGGPEVAAIIHRVAAVTFAAIFFGHLIYIFYHTIIVHKGRVGWFGPYSLLPRWQDFRDFWAMFQWFRGKGPRPVFDHWTYFEKFDYWAPFWGMFVIGISGLMLWFPVEVSQYLPGWVFNVATIVHGEEAFLAAVFLFTVHYFNCHFRPDKIPQDIVMFTGTMPLEEFKHERKVEYDRLVAEGRLDSVLVDPPSKAMTRASEILGMTLIIVGLVLLFLVLSGFTDTMILA